MIRHAAHQFTGTALSAARLVVKLPTWGAQQVLGHVRGSKDGAPAAPTERAEATPTGRPAADNPPGEQHEPEVVLTLDAPPEEVEPPVDVVGEALAEEQAAEAQRPPQPQPQHVTEETEVVYSSTSDEDQR